MSRSPEAWPAGIKKTRPRQQVMAVLRQADAPMSAAQIHSQITSAEGQPWLSTVYRILETFVAHGIAAKTILPGDNQAIYELERQRHRHYAVCLGCRKLLPIANCPMNLFNPLIAEKNFQITDHHLVLFGYCHTCKPG